MPDTLSQGPLRVLMISKACVVGAYQRKLEEIAAHPDIDLTVIVPPAWDGQPLERAHTEGYRLIVEPVRFDGDFHLHHYPGLRRHIREVQPHIVHVDEEPYNLATYQAVQLARRAGARSLFFSWQNLLRRYPPPFSWFERWVLDHVDHAVVGNREAASVWRAKGYSGPLEVIPQFGVDPEIFSPPPQPTAHERFIIGYAGRLVPEKGIDTLIRAVSLLKGEWYLTLVGDGPERARLSELAGLLNIGGSVHFADPLPSTRMPEFYRSLDVLVLPSRTRKNWKEQFGRVLIEAMACAVPVIGSQSGAIPEVIGETGLTFPEGDAYALAESLQRLLLDRPLREALGKAGRQRVLRNFTQAQIAARTVDVYHAVMEA
ncbi:MAG: glycosyltransferase family 4 protein [Anaerolineae bacterium]